MNENDRAREQEIEKRAFQVLEARNKVFRVLYDTVVAVEGAPEDEVFSILCRNFRRISNAQWAALAVYDPASRTMTLEALDAAEGAEVSLYTECIGNATSVPADLVSSFMESQVQDCESHTKCLLKVFPGSIGNVKPTSEAKSYRISCVRDGELIAAGWMQLPSGQRLRMRDLVDTYLSMAGMILQRIDSVKTLRRQEEITRIQRDLGIALSATNSLGDMLRPCVEAAINVSEMDCGWVYLIEETSGELGMAFHKGLSPEFAERISHCAADSDIARLVVAGKPLYGQHQAQDGEGLRANAIVPVHHDGHVIACLSVASHTLDHIPRHTQDVLEAISTQIGIFIARAEAEEALRRSQERYKSLTDNLDICIYRIAAASGGRIVEVNPACCRIFGYENKEELLSLSVNNLHQDSEAMKRFSEELLDTGFVRKREVTLARKDGTSFIGLMSAIAIRNEDGMVTHYDGIVEDITGRKRMEEEFLKIEKLESVGILAGGIAHDLNNFLSAIMGNLSIAETYLRTGKRADEIRERLMEADRAAEQVRNLTQQLLTFSKGGAPIKKLADIHDILRDSAVFALRGSRCRFEFSIPDDLWPVEVDPGQISQVINNLVINADQATPNGGTIRLRAENTDIGSENGLPLESGTYIRISIEDQGTGIPEPILKKIFDPFFTTKQDGNGLGLATSYSIIQRHSGHITVESQEGLGTTFHLYIPAFPAKTPARKEKPEDGVITGTGKIMVMDDEAPIRDVVAEMLRALGYEATTAIDGHGTIALYEAAMKSGSPFDAVIIDLTIPGGMGGLETIQHLLEIDCDVKAIVSSGYSSDAIMSDFREYGFRGVIAKPYKIRELDEVLHKVISKTPS